MKFFRKRQKDQKTFRGRVSNTSGNSSKVFSYRASRNNIEISSNRDVSRGSNSQQSHSSKLNKFILLFSIMAIVGCLIYTMTLENKVKIVPLSATQNQQLLLRNTDVYQFSAERILADSIFNRFKLTINTSTIEKIMKEDYPELDEVKVTIPILGHRPIFQINASFPAFIITNNQGSFIVNNRGRVMMRAEEIKNLSSLKLQTVFDQSGLSIEKGKNILSQQEAQFISTVIEQLRAKNVVIQSITLPTIPNELDVRIIDKPYIVKFNLSDNSLQQIGTYIAVKEKLESDGKVPSQYIDLRVEEKVYYK